MADNLAHPCNRRRVLTIDDLPDDVLLEIFDFCVAPLEDSDSIEAAVVDQNTKKIESWQLLVHVCRRWRGLVFGSPRRLNLQLVCMPRTSARKSLDVWPALPILILGEISDSTVDNVIARLGHNDRIRHIDLEFYTTSQVENLWTAMQVPFPELTRLCLSMSPGLYFSCGPVLPDSFLGGSAPRLRYLALDGFPFAGLPKLLLSATHLVELQFHNIHHSGNISPEAMATCLSVLTSLETLRLYFEHPQSGRRPFLPTRYVLPTLTHFSFDGPNDYLEELVARIDAPQLYRLSTAFTNEIDFDTPELNQFISRTPTLRAYVEARLIFNTEEALVELRQSHPERSDHRMVQVIIVGQEPDRQLSSLAQICALSLSLLLTMENLYIYETPNSTLWTDNTETNNLPDLLLPFTAVKNLYLSKLISPHIALALQDLTGGRTTEVFPALQNIHLEGFQPSEPVQEGIAQFISARQLTNHPVAISVWDRDLAWDQ